MELQMRTTLFALTFLLTFSAHANGQFENGSQFTATSYSGEVHMHCPSQSQVYFCHENQLSPAEFSYFITDNTDANEVNIISNLANGKTREKSANIKNGKSTKRLNLWISTLLQRPLLSLGVNHLQYTLKNNDTVVEQGDFSVEVQEGRAKRCAPLHIWGSTNDCNSQSLACSQYFNRASCSNF